MPPLSAPVKRAQRVTADVWLRAVPRALRAVTAQRAVPTTRDFAQLLILILR
jgi:hypothetical protein